jgi:hypothetical protein
MGPYKSKRDAYEISHGEDSIHRFTDATRQSFLQALTISTMTPARAFLLSQETERLSQENDDLKAEIRGKKAEQQSWLALGLPS